MLNRHDSDPTTPAEKFLAETWEQILEVDGIYLNDTFFDIGGHSLLVMKVITRVHEKTGVKLSPQDFLVLTLEQIADSIASQFNFGEEDNALPPQSTVNSSRQSAEVSELSLQEPDRHETEAIAKTAFKYIKGFWN